MTVIYLFRRHVKSAINEGRLVFTKMQVDESHFPMHTIELQEKNIPGDKKKTTLKTLMLGG